jgi:putative oxidoreductase
MRVPENPDVALLILRITAGGLMGTHGYGKVQMVLDGSTQFADPIGLGMTTSLALAAFAEFFCSLAVAIGLFTRLATIPLIITMAVAAFIVHGADPLAKKELALLFLAAYTAIGLAGPGRFSVDRLLLPRLFRRASVRA